MTDRNVKLEHFVNLVAVAAADGYLDAREREFLTDRAEENGMDAEEYNRIVEDIDALQYNIPLNQEEREDQVNDAIFMAVVDGDISQPEYDLCVSLALSLGIQKQAVDDTVRFIKEVWGIN